MNTIEEAQALIEQFEQLQERAAKVATTLIQLEHNRSTTIDSDEVILECGGLYANWEEYCGCGDYDSHHTHIPLNYLFDKNWVEEASAIIQQREADAAKKEQERIKKAEKATVDRERKQYLKLKAKYEGEES